MKKLFFIKTAKTMLYNKFQKVADLIRISYNDSIIINNDDKTGWALYDGDGPYHWEFSDAV